MTILESLATAIQAVCPIVGVSGAQGSIRIDYRGTPTAGQITAATGVVAAFDWSAAAQATRDANVSKASATSSIDNGALQIGGPTERVVRALVLMILDEFNLHTTFESDLKAAIAAASSLANLQTRVAAITPVPQRTAAQLVTALKAQIAGTVE